MSDYTEHLKNITNSIKRENPNWKDSENVVPNKMTLSQAISYFIAENGKTVNVGKLTPFGQVMYLYEKAMEYGIEGEDFGDKAYRLPNYKLIVPNNSLGFIIKSEEVTVTVNNMTTEMFSYYVGTEDGLKNLYIKERK